MPETAEELCQRPDVRKELVRASGQKPAAEVKAKTTDKFWFVTHVLIIVGCAVLYFLLSAKLLPLPKEQLDIIGRALRAVALIVIVVASRQFPFTQSGELKTQRRASLSNALSI